MLIKEVLKVKSNFPFHTLILKPEEHRYPHAANFYGIKEAWKPGHKCSNPLKLLYIALKLVDS